MSRASENAAFTCLICNLEVAPLSNGGYQNHCPRCLYSQHLDVVPGDRASSCEGMMEPVGVKYKSGKGLQVIHRCVTCGAVCANRAAGGTVQPDNFDVLLRLPAV